MRFLRTGGDKQGIATTLLPPWNSRYPPLNPAPAAPPMDLSSPPPQPSTRRTAALTLAAVGVVYGDIGTSPLYTIKEVFSPDHGLPLTSANLLGVVSLIVWGLIVVVSLKYVSLILRADNRGEGGIMALTALALSSVGKSSRW